MRRPCPRPASGAAPGRADPGEAASRAGRQAPRGLRARDRPPLQPDLAPELRPRHRFLPARFVHDEAQPTPEQRVAALPGHARLRPAPGGQRAQGALELMWLLQQSLAEICGLPHVSLQPSAGSHGELAGLLLTRAYHADRGETGRRFDARHRARDQPGDGDDGRLRGREAGDERARGDRARRPRAKAGDETACLMLTNPNTLGLFDENISEIAKIVHDAGGRSTTTGRI